MANMEGWSQDCPRCGSSDMSQSVSAILAGQTQVTHGSQRSVGAAWTRSGIVPVLAGGSFSGSHQTELARMLDLPPPRPPSSTMGCLAFVLVALGLLIGSYTAWAVMSSGSDQDDDVSTLTAVVGVSFFGSPPLVGGIVLAVQSRRQRRRWPPMYAHWQRAASVHQRLVYCTRDHIVYDPASPEVVIAPVQAPRYAYERAP